MDYVVSNAHGQWTCSPRRRREMQLSLLKVEYLGLFQVFWEGRFCLNPSSSPGEILCPAHLRVFFFPTSQHVFIKELANYQFWCVVERVEWRTKGSSGPELWFIAILFSPKSPYFTKVILIIWHYSTWIVIFLTHLLQTLFLLMKWRMMLFVRWRDVCFLHHSPRLWEEKFSSRLYRR